ncbi:MAG: DUF5009 domain-containing protein [Candidatus Hydrogenedentes bacterium]|nr:DUF5009 domain-containing protein [Candidatus Hydrogenedentota bacterium]
MSGTLQKAQRLVSLDAYRGFAMLAMVTDGLGLSKVAENFKGSRVWEFLSYQTSHVEWTGCAAWDLIQPSFMFITGVAIPYSYAARRGQGKAHAECLRHTAWRAFILVALGVFLRSNGSTMTYYVFEDVLSQIGLGYFFVYLFVNKGLVKQATFGIGILMGYWLLFALWPVLPANVDAKAMGLTADWRFFEGFAAHWNKGPNPAGYLDHWLLNVFPRLKPYTYNYGGYVTLSFVPSMATMLVGLMAGEWLRREIPLAARVKRLAQASAVCFGIAFLLDGNIWPFADWNWTIAPVVKRIWSPGWVIFSSGWTLLLLAVFIYVIDMKGWKKWAFPCIVVGLNPLAMYFLAHTIEGWLLQTVRTHFGQEIFSGVYGPIWAHVTGTFLLWLIILWMWRRRIFIRV